MPPLKGINRYQRSTTSTRSEPSESYGPPCDPENEYDNRYDSQNELVREESHNGDSQMKHYRDNAKDDKRTPSIQLFSLETAGPSHTRKRERRYAKLREHERDRSGRQQPARCRRGEGTCNDGDLDEDHATQRTEKGELAIR